MPYCAKCGKQVTDSETFCSSCGYDLRNVASPSPTPTSGGIITVTTPTVPGYKVVKVLNIIHGMTARTRGIGGKILGSLQSLGGGEVTAFTMELEKAKDEALNRMRLEAQRIGANGVIGVDFETTEIFETVVLVSVLGTAVILEKEA